MQVVREETRDTKGLLASGPRCILLAFRGTATTKSALIDLQALSPPFSQRFPS